MLRIANPGSDIPTFIRIYAELYALLSERESFGLDDFSQVLIERNLATSCGFMGEEALRRSTRDDRSRDPLYNQSKMYSELYKILGWLHPTTASALTFQFTLLGAQIASVASAPIALFEECILGIVYPNPIINVTTDCCLRPFSTILRTMAALDGIICRDELIIGPLSIKDDRSDKDVQKMIAHLRSIRGSEERLSKEMNSLGIKRKISEITMGNYTRFPIAAIKWVGWGKSERLKGIYGGSTPFLVLTDKGRATIKQLESCYDLRPDAFSKLANDTKSPLIRLGYFQMAERAGFDLEPVQKQFEADTKTLQALLGKKSNLLFSPFQSVNTDLIHEAFQVTNRKTAGQSPTPQKVNATKSIGGILTSKVSLAEKPSKDIKADKQIIQLFVESYKKTGDLAKTVDEIKQELLNANQDSFYPFVANLFRTLGYNCEYSRAGVNYQRWDAIIDHPSDSMPIEIKSPGEEEFISVKAVRQALENKIILLARKAYPTHYKTSSLVVGYNLPNNRSEVSSLIADIYKTYNITIGLIDIRSLLFMAGAIILEHKSHNHDDLIHLQGIIDVSAS